MYKISTKNIKYLCVTIIFLILFIVGLKIHNNYGIGGDEPTSRQNGAITINYILEKLNKKTNILLLHDDTELGLFKTPLNEYFDKDYGVVFDAPVFLLERLLKLDDTAKFYQLRKILTYIIFLIGLLSVYKLSILSNNNIKIAILAILMLFTSPRIFGEAFYNSKDIVFMSIFTVSVYRIFISYNCPKFKNILLASLTSALATDIRIVAIVLPVIFIFLQFINIFNNRLSYSDFFKSIFYFINFNIFFIILFWPWLWENPIERFHEAIINMSNFIRLIRWELFQGQYYPTADLPKNYLIQWIIITTPPIYLLLFVIGSSIFLIKIHKINPIRGIDNKLIYNFIYLSILTFFILLTVLKSPVLYNGWRHFYFIYPFFILICLNGVEFLLSIGRKFKIVSFLTFIILSISLILNAYHIYRYHPLEYVYFNHFAGSDWNKKYPMDYSGISGVLSLKFILNYTDKDNIKVSAVGPLSINIHKSLLMLSQSEIGRITLIDARENPDFLVTDYQSFDPKDLNSRFQPKLGYENIYDYLIKGKPVLSIFKKNN